MFDFFIDPTQIGINYLYWLLAPSIQVLEGCWSSQLTIGSMVLKPGESTIIESSVFIIHEGMNGPHNFGVHLKTKDPANPDLIVNVLSNWIP